MEEAQAVKTVTSWPDPWLLFVLVDHDLVKNAASAILLCVSTSTPQVYRSSRPASKLENEAGD